MTHRMDRYSLLPRLAALDGLWVGEVRAPHGRLLACVQFTARWDAMADTLVVVSLVASLGGQVLGVERGQITYDAQTDSAAAVFTGQGGVTDLAHAYANHYDQVVLVSDTRLYLRRIMWRGADGCELLISCVQLAEDDRLHAVDWSILRRVGPATHPLAAA